MRKEIKEAAVYAAVSLVVLLLAAWNFWLRQAAAGVLLLGLGWGCIAANAFFLGARYGIDQAYDREDEDREPSQSTAMLCCPECGCTLFTRAAGAYLCLCCGAVIQGKETRDGEGKV